MITSLRRFHVILCLLFSLAVVHSMSTTAQTSVQNFGTAAAVLTSQTGNATTIAAPTSGTSWARGGATAPNAPISVITTTNLLGSTGAYVRGTASATGSVAKFSPWVGYTPGTEMYTSFKVMFGDATGGASATNGSWTFYQGAGAMYSDVNDFTSAQVFAGLRFTYAGATVNLTNRAAGAFNTTGLSQTSFNTGTVYTFEIVGNNKTSGTINYTYNGTAQSVAVQRIDLYVNGTKIGDDLTAGALASNTNIVSGTFIGINSTSNLANIFVDDAIVYNAVPAAIGVTPTLTRSTATLTGFNYTVGSGPSASQSFTFTGTDLSGAPGNITVSGSTNYEVSSDNISFGATAVYPFSSATLGAQTVYVRLKAGLSPGAYSAETISISGGSASTSVSASGSVTALAPTLSVGALTPGTAFSTTVGTASAAQTFTISASALTAALTVGPLAGYEFSTDGFATAGQSSLSFASSEVSATVSVRLTGASAGSFNGDIVVSSAGATGSPVNITVAGSVTIPPPVITVGALTPAGSFSTTTGTPSAVRTFTLSGQNLTSSVTVAALSGYEYSDDGFATAGQSSLTYNTASVTRTISVRLTGTTIGTYNGNIVVSSTGANGSPASIAVTGSVAAPSLVIAGWDFTGVSTAIATFNATTYSSLLVSSGNAITRGPGAGASTASNSFRTTGFSNNGIATTNTDYFQVTLTPVAGYKLNLLAIDAVGAGTGTFAAAPGVTQQYAYSLDGTNFTLIGSPIVTTGTPVTIPQVDLSAIPALQNVPAGTTVTFRYYASGQTTTGGWGFISGAAGANGLAISGTLVSTTAPVINRSAASVSGLSYVEGSGPSASQSFTLSGENLTGAPANITINTTAATNFEVSADNVSFGATASIPYSASTLTATPVYVRLKAGLTASTYSGTLNISGGSASTSVNLSGTVTPPPALSVSPTAISANFYSEGAGPATGTLVSVSGSNLSGAPGNLLVSGSANYEVSTTSASAGFGTSATLAYATATLTNASVWIRLKAGLTQGSYNGELITITGGSAPAITVTANGSVLPPVPSLNVSPSSLSGFTYISNAGPSVSQSFTLSGANLVNGPGNITVTGSSSFEVSSNNSSFGATASVPYSNGPLSATTLYVRLKAGLAVGTYLNETISIAGADATASITASGSVLPQPVINAPSPTSLTGFATVGGTESASQTFTVSATNLTGNLVLTPGDAAYEISATSATSGYAATLSLTPSAGSIATTTIYVRLAATATAGTKNTSIVISSSNASSQSVTVSGTVTAPSTTFTAGRIAVLQVGNGTTALSGNAAPVRILEFSRTGAAQIPTVSIALAAAASVPTNAPYNIVESGTGTSGGLMTLSTDRKFLVIPGYNATVGTASIASSASATNGRSIGRLYYDGVKQTNGTFNALGGNTYRSVSSNGTNFWMTGANGTVYTATDTTTGTTTTATSVSTTNSRVNQIFNNTLFYTTASVTPGLYVLGTWNSLPTAAASATLLIATGTGSSPYAYAFSPNGLTCYIADDRASASGGILKYTYSGTFSTATGWQGGTWSLAYTLGTGVANIGARGLVADFSGVNPVLFATTAEVSGNRLITITDAGSGSAASTLATATANNIFRGVSFVPVCSNNIAATAGANGTISPAGVTSVDCGADQAYTITPAPGYRVADVLVDGVSQGAITSYTFTNVTAPHTISASFAVANYNITVTQGANGTISPAGTVVVTAGGSQQFVITPAPCYEVSDVIVNGVSQGATTTYTFNNVNANQTITAVFAPSTFTQWTGAVSSDWNNPANWTSCVPNASLYVYIPGNGSGTPVVNVQPVLSADAATGDLEMGTNASLDLNGNTLTINGLYADNGNASLIGSATSNMVINGSNGNTFLTLSSATILTLKNLTVNGGTLTLTTPVNITGGTAPGTGGTVTVAEGAVLESNGFLTLKSNQFGYARVAQGSNTTPYITGDVTVERYIPNNGFRSWRLLSVPVRGSSQTIRQAWQEGVANPLPLQNNLPGFGTIITGTGSGAAAQSAGFDASSSGAALQRYNGSAWVGVSATNIPINSFDAYFLFVRGDRTQTVSGTTTNATTLRVKGPLYTGTFQKSVPANSFTVVPNPFASAINFTSINRSNVNNLFYIWDSKKVNGTSLGAYQSFSATNGYLPTLDGGSYASGVPNTTIESGQAFFVQGGAAAGNVSIGENAKVAGGANAGFRPATNLVKIDNRLFSGTTLVDANVVVFDNEYDNAIGPEDAIKLANAGENFGIQKANGVLAIEGRKPLALQDTVAFKIWNLGTQAYSIRVVPSNMTATPGLTAVLLDKFTNTRTNIDLQNGTTVDFTVTSNVASRAEDRFMIIFRQPSALPVRFAAVSANRTSNSVAVNWTVAQENNIERYEIERSSDGRNFAGVGTVNATALLNYSFADLQAPGSSVYYRIRSVGAAGDVTYSAIVKVAAGTTKAAFAIVPNPAEGTAVNLQFKNQPAGEYVVKLTNNSGQLLMNTKLNHAGGNAVQVLNLPVALPAGVYNATVSDNNKATTVLQVVIK